MEFQPIQKDTDQINSDAESFLSIHNPSGTIPVPIEEIIEFQLQIDIIPIPGLKEGFEKVGLDIDAFISSDFSNITVDEYVQEKFNNRYRFTLAHEIGHKYLHGYLSKQFRFNNIGEWIATINQISVREREIVEWQANEFAGLVLVPRAALKDEFKKAIKETEKLIKTSFDKEPSFIMDLSIFSLASKFAVSKDAVRLSTVQRQAEKLGIFTGMRDLLKCTKCGLVEDVLCDGRLVTYYEEKNRDDSGLRFKHKKGNIYHCPKCGLKASKQGIFR